MRYLLGYAVYATVMVGVLLYVVPPQPPQPAQSPIEPKATVYYEGHVELTVAVVDDYFSQPCTVSVSAMAADMVMFHTREELEEALDAIGC